MIRSCSQLRSVGRRAEGTCRKIVPSFCVASSRTQNLFQLFPSRLAYSVWFHRTLVEQVYVLNLQGLSFEGFKKDDALCQLCKGGSDASRTLSLHHLACRVHEPVERARLLLEVDEGHSITTVLDEARVQLSKEHLYVTVLIHSTRHIELLLSGNAHSNVWLLDGRTPGALEIAPVNRYASVL